MNRITFPLCSANLSLGYLNGIARLSILALLSLVCFTRAAWGQQEARYSFTAAADGDAPTGGVVRDSAGNLYGATPIGGAATTQPCIQPNSEGCGVIYRLTPTGSGGWKESVIHTFTSAPDGSTPMGNLVMDGAGNLYGTTEYGGSGCPGFYGCGTVFELSPSGSGTWTETILYDFAAGTDGNYPEAGVISDSAGNLYGTTAFGGNSGCNTLGCGTVFELTNSAGTWTKTILYVFQDGLDGGEPESPVTMDSAGNLYGTAPIGGDTTGCNPPYGCGTIYELSPGPSGWTETTLYTFQGKADGAFPNAGLAIDRIGNLYGSFRAGGKNGQGYIYRLVPEAGGGFTISSIYSFSLADGAQPMATPLIAGGDIYGTVSVGGTENELCPLGCGGVYRLTPESGGAINYSFFGFGTAVHGAAPDSDLIIDNYDDLFGTTSKGGDHGLGDVFEINR
jgi:uncharacterized repeat protein (TIGR03803 family)